MAAIINFPACARYIISDAISSCVGLFEGFDNGVKVRRADRRVILVGPDGTGKTTLADIISKRISAKFDVEAPIFHHSYDTGLAWFKSVKGRYGYAKIMEGDFAHNWVVYDRHPAIDFPVYDMVLRGGSLMEPYLTDLYDTPYDKWFKLPTVRRALENAIIVLLQDQQVEPSADRGDPECIQGSIGDLRKQYDNAVTSLCQYDRSLTWSSNTVIFRETIN